jgi:type 1 glutamine amidotransferase
VVTHTAGFRHDSIDTARTVLSSIGSQTGLYTAEFADNANDVRQRLTPAGLSGVDAVFFANTTGNIGIPDMAAFLAWVSSGHAVLGAHSATDTYHDDPSFLAMLGGEFLTHGGFADANARVDDPSHPAVSHLGPRFSITDELYRFTRFNRSSVQVLLTMDRNPDDGVGTTGDAADLPLAWHKTHGSGRVFYTALGHRSEVWQDDRFRRHLEGAIRWALGR